MIFLGDIAHPFPVAPDWSVLRDVVGCKPAVVNLEGALIPDTRYLGDPKLFNHSSVLESLHAIDTKVVCLANNHITDIEGGAASTARQLANEGMLPVGAGRDLRDAEKPVTFHHQGRDHIFVAFGWSTIQCVPARQNREGVNPFNPKRILGTIANLRKSRPDAVIVAMFHWNIEMERYPQPAHRQLAFSVIDNGANAVVGHHPHCVGGFEIYRGCPIAYSLGDWWLPQGVFFNGYRIYPDYTLRQVALEWDVGETPILHWFDYDRTTHAISYHSSQPLAAGDALEHTPFAGLSHTEYKRWFRQHRVKRKALPVYDDYRAKYRNHLRDWYIRIRHPLITVARKIV